MTQPTEPTCSHCGSTKIIHGVRVGKTAEVGNIGLSFRTAVVLTGTEPLVADLCDSCGTVVRLYVQEVGKRWHAE
jgi:hypothetical protein